MAKIAIDFDGVICERYGIPRGLKFQDCPPTDNCAEALKFLKKDHELYIFTNRTKEEWPKITKWLKDNSCPPLRITNIKEKDTSIYLDDRAVRFTCWMDFCKLIA